MNGRVGELAVRYRIRRGATMAAAQVPLLDRVMQAGLAHQVAEQIAAIGGDDREVVVLREATARLTLRPADWSLDRAMLERVSRAAREAVIAQLARPAEDDAIVRFAHEAEFVGSFVVDLLGGAAWDRWYYGSFRRFRRSGARETLESLLADQEIDRASVFAWLEGRGKLAEVLHLIGPSRARQLALGPDAAPADRAVPADIGPLALAAFAIVDALGLHIERAREAALVAEYYAAHRDRPAWDDRIALTAWVWAFARWILTGGAGVGAPKPIGQRDIEVLRELLAQRLDWLDAEWLERRVTEELPEEPAGKVMPARVGAARAVAPRHGALLLRLARLIRQGTTRLDPFGETRDQLVVRMVAALEAAGDATGTRDLSFVMLLEQICDACRDGPALPPALGSEPAVTELLAVLAAQPRSDALGIETRGAGLYLLTRAVSDLRLVALAERAGVPREPLLGALARKLLGIPQPFDQAVAAWIGGEDPALDALGTEPLLLLQQMLMERLIDQKCLDGAPDQVHHFTWRGKPFTALSDTRGTCWMEAGSGDAAGAATLRGPGTDLGELAPLECVSAEVEVLVTSIASGLMRAWSRWLPGLGGSSMPFLVRQCLARTGRVILTDAEAEVTLEPAPLDSVLELAGYFKPMEFARWLGRRVRFSVARSRR